MPFNLVKIYPELLELGHLPVPGRNRSMTLIFKRDIEDNPKFNFRSKLIRPTKSEEIPMQALFKHLTTEEVEEVGENGRTYKKREFEMFRSRRLHWIRPHIDEKIKETIEVFSTEERDEGKTVFRTYVYNVRMKYVIVMEPQRSNTDYYLLSAYYLNRSYGEKEMKKKMKKKLQDIL